MQTRNLSFAVTVVLTALGCSGGEPSQPARDDRVYAVPFDKFTRDRAVAQSYVGRKVLFRLEPADYEISGGTLRVWINDRNVPPVVICPDVSGTGARHIIVEGRVASVTVDKISRQPGINFFVTIEGARITATSRPE